MSVCRLVTRCEIKVNDAKTGYTKMISSAVDCNNTIVNTFFVFEVIYTLTERQGNIELCLQWNRVEKFQDLKVFL